MTRRRAAAWVATALVVAALVAVAFVTGPANAHANHVTVDAQVTADGSVLVETVFATETAWLAVHADDGGDPGRVLGVRQVESGFRTDVRVGLEDGAASNRTAWVVLHGSDGDGEFDPAEDEPLASFGSVVAERFELGVGDREAAVTAERFRPQNATASSVVVRRVAMPADGRLAIQRDAVGPGEIVASRALSAGVHENVTVDVPESFLASEETVTAWAVVHLADGDAALGRDTAFRVGTEVVGTTFGVRGGPTPADGTGSAGASGTATAETPTDDDGVVTATPTPGAPPTGTTAADAATATRGSGPGPGVGGALAAALVIALLALERRRR
jgi:hypothetical protein